MKQLPEFKTDPTTLAAALAHHIPELDAIVLTSDWKDACDEIHAATGKTAATFGIDDMALYDTVHASGYWQKRKAAADLPDSHGRVRRDDAGDALYHEARYDESQVMRGDR